AVLARWSGSSVECVDDVGRDPAPRRDVVAVAARPFPDCRALLAVDGSAAATGAGTSASTTADATAGFDPLLQIVAQFRGIFGRKVDLIGHPVETEFDGFIGGALTVEIIDQGDGHFLRHWLSLTLSS